MASLIDEAMTTAFWTGCFIGSVLTLIAGGLLWGGIWLCEHIQLGWLP